ncbi:uncharacterized protein LOC135840502 [Planococcus citri]|uniref:uncharacterized protein LOC135840502 n=1 Tax=Planococcus citri TaxID=170843 RepID=UPI0031F8449C
MHDKNIYQNCLQSDQVNCKKEKLPNQRHYEGNRSSTRIDMSRSFNFEPASLVKWYETSMCRVFRDSIGLWTIFIAELLSPASNVVSKTKPSDFKRFLWARISTTASAELRTTHRCFLDFHCMAQPYKNTMKPDVETLSALSPA